MIRGTIKRSNSTKSVQELQVEMLADEDPDEGIELFETGGVSFRAYAESDVLIDECGSAANRVALLPSARTKRPTTQIEEGEGGLYYAGVYRVFVKSDGMVFLGTKDATDFVALASKVEAELTKIKTAISGAAVVANDGGAAFKSNIVAALNSTGMGASGSTAATKVKAV